MTVDGAIKVGEKAIKDLAEKKETARVATLSEDDRKKDEAKKVQDAKAIEDKKVLDIPEDKLTDEQKTAKAALLETQKKDAEVAEKTLLESKDEALSAEEKEKKDQLLKSKASKKEDKRKADIEDRIKKLSGEIKAEKHLREQDQKKSAELQAELDALKATKDPNKVKSDLNKIARERIAAHLLEDKSLPREEKREMPDDDLQEWYAEDMLGAQNWVSDRAIRRYEDKKADAEKASKPSEEETNKKVTAVLARQKESQARVVVEHPELDISERMFELKGEGKSFEEAQAIVFKERPKVKLVADILKEDKENKYRCAEDGPELLAKEMEKRLQTKKEGKEETKETQEERDARIAAEAVQAERDRQSSIDEGLNSTRGKAAAKDMGALEKEQWTLFQKQWPDKGIKEFNEMLARRRKL